MSCEVVVTGASYVSENDVDPAFGNTDIAGLDFASQIPNRSDKRAQGLSQQLACYVAGLALDQSGLKNAPDILEYTDILVATAGGERDEARDRDLLEQLGVENPDFANVNRELSNLRPSLFLAMLQNLFAANISIVFGILGSSVTFMGETLAGSQAIDEARKRIASGRSKVAVVGGVFNGNRDDIKSIHALTMRDPSHAAKSGGCPNGLGVGSGFVVLESKEHALARHARILAELDTVSFFLMEDLEDWSKNRLDDVSMLLTDFAGPNGEIDAGRSGAPSLPTVNLSGSTGSLMEASMPLSLAVAVSSLQDGRPFRLSEPHPSEESEHPDTRSRGIGIICAGPGRHAAALSIH